MKRSLTIAGWLGRLTLGVVVVGFLALVGAQFMHMLARNVATAAELRTIERDVIALRAHKRDLEGEIRRLSDPRGAVPEIHDRLHLSGPHEAIIYLKGASEAER